MIGPKLPYRYDHYTWPEIRDLVKKQPVVVLPVGSTEDHGHHLPLDVDTFRVQQHLRCRRATDPRRSASFARTSLRL